MKITGKTTLFVEHHEGAKPFDTYSTTVSHKNEDGSYLNANLEVRFTQAFLTEEKRKALKPNVAYQLEVKDGWLDVRSFTTKDGTIARVLMLVVNDATVLSKKNCNKTKDELPF